MMLDTKVSLDNATCLDSNGLFSFFNDEIANEDFGGVSPATIESATDSLAQNPNGFELTKLDKSNLVTLSDVLPLNTKLIDVLCHWIKSSI